MVYILFSNVFFKLYYENDNLCIFEWIEMQSYSPMVEFRITHFIYFNKIVFELARSNNYIFTETERKTTNSFWS